MVIIIIITYLFEGRQTIFIIQLIMYFESVIKNSDRLIQIRLVSYMTNIVYVVHKTLKDILDRRCYWHDTNLEFFEK